MGGGSAKGRPRDLTDEEKQTVCNVACKEMSTLTAKHAISKFEKIVVVAPKAVNQFRDNSKRCRDAGEEVKETINGSVGGDNAAANVADKAIEASGKVAGADINAALLSAADAMDKAVDGIQKPFTEVGRDIVKAKKNEIVGIFVKYINGYNFPGAYKLVREGENSAISLHLTVAMVKPLAHQLLQIVQGEIGKHAVTKAWDLAIEQTNNLIKVMKENVPNLMEKYGPTEITLDINIHIVTKVIEEIARFMGEKEIQVRKAPAKQSTKPFMFEACFTPSTNLTKQHLADEHANK